MFIDSHLIESVCASTAASGIRAIESMHAAGITDSSWESCDGGALIAMGADRFVNRALGIGLGGTEAAHVLDQVERFYDERGLTPSIEVCPWAGALIEEMATRGYVVEEVRDFYAHDLRSPPSKSSIEIREVPGEDDLDGPLASAWVEILASNHDQGTPQWSRAVEFFRIAQQMPERHNLIAVVDGVPCSTGSLTIIDSIGEFGAATTLTSFRGRGAQQALIAERLQRAKEYGCTHAVVVAMPGSTSSRNLQRAGFELLFNSILMRRP